MSPARSRKAASARKPAGKAKGKAARPKAARRPAKAAAGRKAKPARPAPKGPAKPTGPPAHAHCAATDPFGGACQNLPRRPSRYCVIHSYLER